MTFADTPRRATPALLLLLALLGSTAPDAVGSATPATPVCDQRPLTFRPPVNLDSGYEPSIEIDSEGTVFVTAHKFALLADGDADGPRLSSGLWRSIDDGRTFQRMDGPAAFNRFAYAFEGDLALDAKDRLYFADTYLADNHTSRFSDRGATMDFWRPLVASAEPADDRPWLAAHGDGYVYYMSNIMLTPARGRLVVHRSTDAGLTFDPLGFRIPGSGWGFLDADPNSPYVYAFVDSDEIGALTAWISPDRGQTWTSSYVADYRFFRDEMGFPNVAVSPLDGSVYTIWSDGSARIFLGRSTDRGASWDVHDVTPFKGQYLFPWVTVGPNGDVGINFSADPSIHPGPNWFVYGMVWRPDSGCLMEAGDEASMCTGPSASYGRLMDGSTGGAYSQADFFQSEFSADHALNTPFTGPPDPGSIVTQVLYTKQTSGPNMSGSRFCGVVGTP